MDTCCVSGCAKRVWAKGMCSTHYNRQLTTGTTDAGPRGRASLEDRFWRYVEKRGDDECWPWHGKSTCKEYGYIGAGGRSDGKILSHRLSWVIHNGPIDDSQVIRHKCHNRKCCNPKHLIPGTQAENVADMWGRKDGPMANAKLTKRDVLEILDSNLSSMSLASIYAVSQKHIYNIRKRKCWKDL